MRQYRYSPVRARVEGKTSTASVVLKWIIGWHVIGFSMYYMMKNNARKRDPEGKDKFDKRSSDEQLRVMQGKNPSYQHSAFHMSPSGIKREVFNAETKDTYKLTLRGFTKVSEEKLYKQPSTDSTDSTKIINNEDIENIAVNQYSTTKEEISHQTSSQVDNVSSSISSSILNWFRWKKADV